MGDLRGPQGTKVNKVNKVNKINKVNQVNKAIKSIKSIKLILLKPPNSGDIPNSKLVRVNVVTALVLNMYINQWICM